MSDRWSRRRTGLLVAAIGVPVLLLALVALSLLNTAGRLPWQEDPTRIPITPFANIPGNGLTGNPSPTPDPATPAARLPADLTGADVAVTMGQGAAPANAGPDLVERSIAR